MTAIQQVTTALSSIEVTLVINDEHFVLLPIMLSLLNRVCCQLDSVLDARFQFFDLGLANPVLKTSFREVDHRLSQMVNSGFQKVFSMLLELHYLFPLAQSSLRFRIIKPGESVG